MGRERRQVVNLVRSPRPFGITAVNPQGDQASRVLEQDGASDVMHVVGHPPLLVIVAVVGEHVLMAFELKVGRRGRPDGHTRCDEFDVRVRQLGTVVCVDGSGIDVVVPSRRRL